MDTNATNTQEELPFTIALVADPQLGFIDKPSGRWEKEVQYLETAISKLNHLHPLPKLLVLCGDLTHASPDDEVKKLQLADLLSALARLNDAIKPVFVCGNHDAGDVMTSRWLRMYRDQFGPDYFSFWHGATKFLVLNSEYYFTEQTAELQEEYHKYQQWLKEELADPQSRQHFIAFQHYPPFIADAEEPPAIVPKYPSMTYNIPDVGIRQELLEALTSAGVEKLFCGHFHQNIIRWYKDMEIITTENLSCKTELGGIRLIKIAVSSVFHAFFKIDQIPSTF